MVICYCCITRQRSSSKGKAKRAASLPCPSTTVTTVGGISTAAANVELAVGAKLSFPSPNIYAKQRESVSVTTEGNSSNSGTGSSAPVPEGIPRTSYSSTSVWRNGVNVLILVWRKYVSIIMCVPPKSCQFIIIIICDLCSNNYYAIYHCHIIPHQVMNLNFLCDRYYIVIVNLTMKFMFPNFSRLGRHSDSVTLSLPLCLCILLKLCWYYTLIKETNNIIVSFSST